MFVFVHSSYHLNLSFPHLVVILTTLGTPKNIFCFKNNILNKTIPGKNITNNSSKLFTNY